MHPRYFVGGLDSGKIQKQRQHSFVVVALETVQSQAETSPRTDATDKCDVIHGVKVINAALAELNTLEPSSLVPVLSRGPSLASNKLRPKVMLKCNKGIVNANTTRDVRGKGAAYTGWTSDNQHDDAI
jgi:hypothetical protein